LSRKSWRLSFGTRGTEPYVVACRFDRSAVPDEVHRAADARLFIPLAPGARSLNVVTAAAIALGEGLRQTNGFPSAGGNG